MSGSDDGERKCCCTKSQCFSANCGCLKANLLCSKNCKCKNCKNNEENKAKVNSIYNEYKERISPGVVKYTSVPPGGFLVPPGFSGCKCRRCKCATFKCACFEDFYRCTLNCECQDCANPKGIRGSDKNTEPGQSKDSVSSVPREALQITPSRDNRGSDSNKRPRNN